MKPLICLQFFSLVVLALLELSCAAEPSPTVTTTKNVSAPIGKPPGGPERVVATGSNVPTQASYQKSERAERINVTGSNIPTYANVWTTFSRQGDELANAGMCTYVLLGKQVDKQSDPETYRLYERFLNELSATTGEYNAADLQDLDHYNVFHVPTKQDASADDPLIDQYNYALSKRYLNKFAQAMNYPPAATKLQSGAGPFLITTMKPLPITSTDVYVLYADLSGLHPTAISELLRAYKARVTTRRVTKNEAFGPISIHVLSGILNAEDDLAIAKVSVLAWINFGKKGN